MTDSWRESISIKERNAACEVIFMMMIEGFPTASFLELSRIARKAETMIFEQAKCLLHYTNLNLLRDQLLEYVKKCFREEDQQKSPLSQQQPQTTSTNLTDQGLERSSLEPPCKKLRENKNCVPTVNPDDIVPVFSTSTNYTKAELIRHWIKHSPYANDHGSYSRFSKWCQTHNYEHIVKGTFYNIRGVIRSEDRENSQRKAAIKSEPNTSLEMTRSSNESNAERSTASYAQWLHAVTPKLIPPVVATVTTSDMNIADADTDRRVAEIHAFFRDQVRLHVPTNVLARHLVLKHGIPSLQDLRWSLTSADEEDRKIGLNALRSVGMPLIWLRRILKYLNE